MPWTDEDMQRVAREAASAAVKEYAERYGTTPLSEQDADAVKRLADEPGATEPPPETDEQRFAAQLKAADGGWVSTPLESSPTRRPQPPSPGRAA